MNKFNNDDIISAWLLQSIETNPRNDIEKICW